MIKRTSYIELNLDGTPLQDHDRSGMLFFDIETTGFTASTSSLYLIGAVSWVGDGWVVTQWLAEHPQEEAMILAEFLAFAKPFTQLIHFNGDRFDIPYLQEKSRYYQLSDSLSTILSRDLYRMIRPLKTLLKLPALNQRALEEYLGIFREDPYTGGELIRVYEDYVKHPTDQALHDLLLHNLNDLEGMLSILPILSYQAVQNGDFRVATAQIVGDSVIVRAWLPLMLPQTFSYRTEHMYLTGSQDQLAFEIYGIHDTLKYFFPDYKNYYYLPMEDMAIHKSVAAYVDKEHREPAKASTCYNRKKGFYLPQPEAIYTPVFRRDYHDRQMYFACKQEFVEDTAQMHDYLMQLIEEI
ncbi:MAG: ribonuclease H-like domain-containing protein [Eubacteriales bacterium]|nr:ribonuclease H-like domain-containing protein [Eubacteriales bacterium]